MSLLKSSVNAHPLCFQYLAQGTCADFEKIGHEHARERVVFTIYTRSMKGRMSSKLIRVTTTCKPQYLKIIAKNTRRMDMATDATVHVTMITKVVVTMFVELGNLVSRFLKYIGVFLLVMSMVHSSRYLWGSGNKCLLVLMYN
jgi:hypothetical protein